jgi:TonB-dependent SusC/RagA subfamily outer membrane receptor
MYYQFFIPKRIVYFLFLGLFMVSAFNLDAQRKRWPKSIKGEITNANQEALKDIQIYLDMARTKESTNKKGKYKVDITPDLKLITAYHPKYGFINWKYNGEKTVNFLFPEDSEPLGKNEMKKLGYTIVLPKKPSRKDYASFTSVLEILGSTFNNVRVINGEIFIGRRGQHTVTGSREPLILVNDVPIVTASLGTIPTTEIKSINVIDKASEAAAYGFRGANGVIIIKLLDGSEEFEKKS